MYNIYIIYIYHIYIYIYMYIYIDRYVEFSMLVQVSYRCNLQAHILLPSKNTRNTKI